MNSKPPTPLQAGFWLTDEEKGYILTLFAIFLVGVVARYFYLKHETPKAYTPEGIKKTETRINVN
jgi:hypothetical protein